MSDARIIIDGPTEFAADVVAAIIEGRESLDQCKVGWGWGIVNSRGWEAFIRRTKTGYSAKVSARTGGKQ